MRFTRIVLYRAGSCKVCTLSLNDDNEWQYKTVKPTMDAALMIAYQLIENKY